MAEVGRWGVGGWGGGFKQKGERKATSVSHCIVCSGADSGDFSHCIICNGSDSGPGILRLCL